MRQRLSCILILTLLYCSYSYASDNPQQWDDANAWFEQGNYIKAIETYKTIDNWEERPDVLYNMGGAAFSASQLGEAILFFEKAYRLNPSSKKILHNLNAARKRIDNPYNDEPFVLVRAGLNMFSMAPAWVWIVLLLVLAFVSGWFFLMYRQRRIRFISIITWIVFAGLSACFFSATQYLSREDLGIAVKYALQIYEDEDLSDVLDRTVPEGMRVKVLKRTDRFVHFQLPNGILAYLPPEYIENI